MTNATGRHAAPRTKTTFLLASAPASPSDLPARRLSARPASCRNDPTLLPASHLAISRPANSYRLAAPPLGSSFHADIPCHPDTPHPTPNRLPAASLGRPTRADEPSRAHSASDQSAPTFPFAASPPHPARQSTPNHAVPPLATCHAFTTRAHPSDSSPHRIACPLNPRRHACSIPVAPVLPDYPAHHRAQPPAATNPPKPSLPASTSHLQPVPRSPALADGPTHPESNPP
jgi:hypothetical protein